MKNNASVNVPHTLIYQKSTGNSDSEEETGDVRISIDKDDENVDDDFDDSSFSSSTDTSYDALSIGDCLEILSGNLPNYPQESPDDPVMLTDGDIVLFTCGELATDPRRNQRSFSRRHIMPHKKRSKSHGAYDDRIVAHVQATQNEEALKDKEENLPLILCDEQLDDQIASNEDVTNQQYNLPQQPLTDQSAKLDNDFSACPGESRTDDTSTGLPHDCLTDTILNNENLPEPLDKNILETEQSDDHLKRSDNLNQVETEPEARAKTKEDQSRTISDRNRPEFHISDLASDEDVLVTMNPLPEVIPVDLRDLKTGHRASILKSPQKSHSENSLADLLAGKAAEEEKVEGSEDPTQTTDEEQAQRKFKNPFRNFNFSRGNNIRASQRKAKMLLEMQLRSQKCQSRFIQL